MDSSVVFLLIVTLMYLLGWILGFWSGYVWKGRSSRGNMDIKN